MRIMGLDVGSVRVGVAISDETLTFAQPLKNIQAEPKNLVLNIIDLCLEHQVDHIVIGLPLSLSGGNQGQSSKRALALGKALEKKTQIKITFRDERFSSLEAKRSLIEGGAKRKKQKILIDQVAAALILQGYLDEQNQKKT